MIRRLPAGVVQAVLFQLTWFACVLGGAAGTSIWGGLALLALVAFAVAFGDVAADLALAFGAVIVGFLIDTLWIRTGVLDYAGAAVAPAWIVMLWAAVGLSVNHSLAMFRDRPWLGGALAAAAAPFSYLAGQAFGAVTVPAPPLLAAVSAVWLLLFAIIFMLARRGIT